MLQDFAPVLVFTFFFFIEILIPIGKTRLHPQGWFVIWSIIGYSLGGLRGGCEHHGKNKNIEIWCIY